jgi:hypothetical protein
MVALMQFTAAMGTEILNIVVICHESNPFNIVQNFLVFLFVCSIEDVIA